MEIEKYIYAWYEFKIDYICALQRVYWIYRTQHPRYTNSVYCPKGNYQSAIQD